MLFTVILFLCPLAIYGYSTTPIKKNLVVLAAPSIWDTYYEDTFYDVIDFQIKFAKMIAGHDDVIVLADKHTMPYLDGRTHKIKVKLPIDQLLSANVYDIHLREFAPFGLKQMIKFDYRPRGMDIIASKQIDNSMKRFLKKNKLKLDKNEGELILRGSDVIDNGKDKAIINERVLLDNSARLPDWAVMIKLLHAFQKVAMVAMPEKVSMAKTNFTMRLDDLLSFVDEDIAVLADVDKNFTKDMHKTLFKKFRTDVSVIDIPMHYGNVKPQGICGIYSALLSTDSFVYVPVFGNDPKNWDMGHSSMTDRMVTQLIEVNTNKQVIPINVPRVICEMGLSLKSVAWKVKGEMAEKLIQMAKWQGRRRYFRH